MQRFFLNIPLGSAVTVTDPDFVHQVSRVLRAKPGDEVVLFDGDGDDWTYRIAAVAAREARLDPVGKTRNAADPAQTLTLWQALPNKHEKLEYLVQKGVECGISAFHIWRADRSQDLFWNDKKMERLDAIAREALEQCGGNRRADVTMEKGLPADLAGAFFLHTAGDGALTLPRARAASAGKPVTLLVGPEGGFSPRETSALRAAGALPVHCGARILRTETAGPAAAFAWLNG